MLAAAEQASVPMRLIGGLAVRLASPERPLLPRECKDIDFVTPRGTGRPVEELMAGLGYESDQRFNGINGHRRLLFYDVPHARQVDVFVGSFEMCHAIPLQKRLLLATRTLPLADLLLTKLQIFALNEKDLRDVLNLLYHHKLSEQDADEEINAAYVARLCCSDWGLWKTCTLNLERARTAAARYDLTSEQEGLITSRIDDLRRHVDAGRKSTKWKVRARIGERVQWYDEPEEVH